MIFPPQPTRLPVYDWSHALMHLLSVRTQIEASLDHFPVGARNAIVVLVRPLEHRYAAGERSAELYEAMMAVRFQEG